MQVSSSDHCERSILSTVFICAKGQINEECLLRNLESWESLSLEDTSDLVLGRALVADAAVWQLPATRNHVACSGSRMSRASNNFCHAGRTKICPRSKSCQSCPLNGHSCSNPVHSNHQSRTESTHASVKQWPLWESHSLHSFHFAKGQINEECLLRNVESWASLSLADTSDLVFGRALVLMLLCDRILGILLLPATRNHVACSGSRMSRASNNFCHAGRTNICSRSMSWQSCQLNGHSCSNPVHSNHQYRTESTHACRQAVTSCTVRELSSPQFPFSQRASLMKSVSFAMLRAENSGVFQTHETLCQEDSWLLVLLCDCFHKSSHYQGSRMITLPNPVRSEIGQSIKQLLPCWKNKNTCPNSMSCQSCQLNGHSCSNSVHSNHQYQTESTCRCQAVTTVREPFSQQFPFLQRVRSMKSVSVTMCNVESWKAGVFQAHETLCLLGADASRCVTGFRQANWWPSRQLI